MDPQTTQKNSFYENPEELKQWQDSRRDKSKQRISLFLSSIIPHLQSIITSLAKSDRSKTIAKHYQLNQEVFKTKLEAIDELIDLIDSLPNNKFTPELENTYLEKLVKISTSLNISIEEAKNLNFANLSFLLKHAIENIFIKALPSLQTKLTD